MKTYWFYFPRYVSGASRVLTSEPEVTTAREAENAAYVLAAQAEPLSALRSMAARRRDRGIFWSVDEQAGEIPRWVFLDLVTSFTYSRPISRGDRGELKAGSCLEMTQAEPGPSTNFEGSLYRLHEQAVTSRDGTRSRLLSEMKNLGERLLYAHQYLAASSEEPVNSLGIVQAQGTTIDVYCAAYAAHSKQVAQIEALILGKSFPR